MTSSKSATKYQYQDSRTSLPVLCQLDTPHMTQEHGEKTSSLYQEMSSKSSGQYSVPWHTKIFAVVNTSSIDVVNLKAHAM